jgi:hypothetical protein
MKIAHDSAHSEKVHGIALLFSTGGGASVLQYRYR